MALHQKGGIVARRLSFNKAFFFLLKF